MFLPCLLPLSTSLTPTFSPEDAVDQQECDVPVTSYQKPRDPKAIVSSDSLRSAWDGICTVFKSQ